MIASVLNENSSGEDWRHWDYVW